MNYGDIEVLVSAAAYFNGVKNINAIQKSSPCSIHHQPSVDMARTLPQQTFVEA
jgi:hypothetical protein